ncbi:DnaJ domain-containing protein [Ochromonadaceae sp. CCMP2298]|nr:DnaJ domain-containing protein [Ochromonadaceae sp. CCMP2298]
MVEQADFDTAKGVHERKLEAWGTDPSMKKKRNVRSLLSTMHTVLWEGTRWKTVGLGDLLEPRQVKLAYRKAMLVVHPDHCVTATNEHKFISKRIFEAVNEAYNEFLTKESV